MRGFLQRDDTRKDRLISLHLGDSSQFGSAGRAVPLGTGAAGLEEFLRKVNRLSFFNPTAPNPAASGFPGILEFAGSGPDSCGCSTDIATYHGMIQPRIGLAYSINSKTVFRAG